MAECQGQDRDYQHQSAGHEFLCLPQPDREHNQQRGHDDVCQRAAEARRAEDCPPYTPGPRPYFISAWLI